jgi:hypothetical protein
MPAPVEGITMKRGDHQAGGRNVNMNGLKRVVRFVERYSPLLTIAAMVIALSELWVVHRSAGDIETLARSAATRYINKFPNNMRDLTSLIGATEEDMFIACDFAAYGNFSAPEEFEAYFTALKALRSGGKRVHVLCYSPATARAAMDKQFGNDFDSIKAGPTFRDFFSNHPGIPEPQNLQELFAFFWERERKYRCEMIEIGIDLKEVNTELPIFFWIGDDGKRAALSFYAYGNDPREMSFQTVDAALISTLKEVASRIQTTSVDKGYACD